MNKISGCYHISAFGGKEVMPRNAFDFIQPIANRVSMNKSCGNVFHLIREQHRFSRRRFLIYRLPSLPPLRTPADTLKTIIAPRRWLHQTFGFGAGPAQNNNRLNFKHKACRRNRRQALPGPLFYLKSAIAIPHSLKISFSCSIFAASGVVNL